MRNLKKLLAVIVAICLVATLSVPAFAADSFTYGAQAQTLNDLGLYKGVSTTSFVPDLGSALDRQTGVVLLLRVFGLESKALAMTDADVTAALKNFTDAATLPDWSKKQMAYAIANGLVKGMTDTTIGPKEALNGKMYASLILRQLGFADAAYDTATTTLADKGGLTAAEATTFATKAMIKDDLVGMTFGSLKAKDSAGKVVIDNLVAAGVVLKDAAVKAGLVSAETTATAKITGAKTIVVTFSQAIDTTKATIAVKKGTVAVNTDGVVYAADKLSATITTTTDLTKGDYTVTVSGLTTTALTSTVTAEDVKVAKIVITSPKAPRVDGNEDLAVVSYQVLNQYGEKMTGQGISWTISTGKNVVNESNTSGDGTFDIQTTNGDDFVPGAIVYITGVHAASGTVVNGQVEIALASQADAVVFKGTYSIPDSKLKDLPAGFADGDYVLLFDVMDQYGNKIDTPDVSKLVFTSNNPLFVSSDTGSGAFAQSGDVTIDDTTYTAVDLKAGTQAGKGGSVTIQAISTVTGKISTFSIQAEASAAVKSFSMSAPAGIIAEGEDVEIPFTALDQYGKAITKYDDLTGLTFSPAYGGVPAVGLRLVKQDDGSAKLMYQAPNNVATKDADYPVYLTSLVTDGGSFSSLMVYVKDKAVPTSIAGIDADALTTSIARNNHVDLTGDDFIVLDQYGRTISDDDVKAWLDAAGLNHAIIVTSTKPALNDVSPFAVTSTDGAADAATQNVNSSTDTLTLTAKNVDDLNATEKITVELTTDITDPTATIQSSAKTITLTEVQRGAYASYTADDLGKMYNDGKAAVQTNTDYDKTVAVYGVMANGTKIALPASDFVVTLDSTKLGVTNDVISDVAAAGYDVAADFTNSDGDAQNVTVNALITVNDAAGVALDVIEKTLTVSNDDPEVAAVTFTSDVTDGKATIHPDDGAHNITPAIMKSFIDTVKDQYGVDFVEAPVITITSLVKADGSAIKVAGNGTAAATITGQVLGDKFTCTFKYGSGVTAKVIFTVGLEG